MEMPLILNIIEYYAPKYLRQDPDTPTYMEALSDGEDFQCEALRAQQEDSTEVPELR